MPCAVLLIIYQCQGQVCNQKPIVDYRTTTLTTAIYNSTREYPSMCPESCTIYTYLYTRTIYRELQDDDDHDAYYFLLRILRRTVSLFYRIPGSAASVWFFGHILLFCIMPSIFIIVVVVFPCSAIDLKNNNNAYRWRDFAIKLFAVGHSCFRTRCRFSN